MAAFSQSGSAWLSAVFLILTGAGLMVQMAASNTLIQTMVDEDKRGRVMGFFGMAFQGAASRSAACWSAGWPVSSACSAWCSAQPRWCWSADWRSPRSFPGCANTLGPCMLALVFCRRRLQGSTRPHNSLRPAVADAGTSPQKGITRSLLFDAGDIRPTQRRRPNRAERSSRAPEPRRHRAYMRNHK